jgi:hypothetical protein
MSAGVGGLMHVREACEYGSYDDRGDTCADQEGGHQDPEAETLPAPERNPGPDDGARGQAESGTPVHRTNDRVKAPEHCERTDHGRGEVLPCSRRSRAAVAAVRASGVLYQPGNTPCKCGHCQHERSESGPLENHGETLRSGALRCGAAGTGSRNCSAGPVSDVTVLRQELTQGHWQNCDRQALGAAGELLAAAQCALHGYQVYRPVADDRGIDFLIDLGAGRHIEVQVKTLRPPKGDYTFMSRKNFPLTSSETEYGIKVNSKWREQFAPWEFRTQLAVLAAY